MDRAKHAADAPPQPRYRGLTLPKLRFGRVKMVAISAKCQDFDGMWPEVEKILDEFRWMGIHIADVNPGNIRF